MQFFIYAIGNQATVIAVKILMDLNQERRGFFIPFNIKAQHRLPAVEQKHAKEELHVIPKLLKCPTQPATPLK